MPPKGQSKTKAGGRGGGGKVEEVDEEPLQAVVLADSYNNRFGPLAVDKPRCLLPFLNAPLLEWTLESLALAGVASIFVLARAHATQIRSYLSSPSCPWSSPASSGGVRITVISTPEARSIGDALRELDAKQLIRGDFVLVHADGVGNLDVKGVVEAHKARRAKDRDAIMTMCCMPVGKGSRTRPYGDAPLLVLAPPTSSAGSANQLVHYESVRAVPRKKAVHIPAEVFEEHPEVVLRNDLVDCGVDICSLDVPPLFSENFDYQDLRRDFVTGILTSDLLDSKIFVHVAAARGAPGTGAGYAARVRDTRSYDAISRDVLGRWTYPLVPDAHMPGGETYGLRQELRYVAQDVVLSRTCTLGPCTLLGARSQISDGATVHSSVIGPDVSIGARSNVHGSYIWAGARVGADCQIDRCIVGEGVVILDGTHLSKGTLVAGGCIIGPGVTLPPFSRVGKRRITEVDDDDDWEEDESKDDDTPTGKAQADEGLGKGAVGFFWPALGEEDEDTDDEADEIEDAQNASVLQLAADLDDVDLSDAASTLSSISVDSDLYAGSERSSVTGATGISLTLPSGTDGTTGLEAAAASARSADFRAEALASLTRAFDEGHTIENAAIELKTLRMASNVPLSEVRRIVIPFVLERCVPDKPRETAQVLERWGGLIENLASDDEVEALVVMQNYCATHPSHTKLFIPFLKKFYNDDIVSDEAIVSWWRSAASRSSAPEAGGETGPELRRQAEDVIRFILESGDSSEEESD